MQNHQLELAIIGLGKMGANLARNAMDKGIRVVGYTLGGASEDLIRAGLVNCRSIQEIKQHLKPPRKVFLYIPAGPAVDEMLDQLMGCLDPGDILIDGGNSYWGDSIRRHDKLAQKGFRFIDLGTSGGVSGAREGACFMAGGDDEVVAQIEPILLQLAVQGGYVHAGPPGAGHFTKLVHNGIEFGMLQAIGEGIDLLEHFPVKLKIDDVLRCWRYGSVIRSWLVDLMEEAYRQEGGLANIPPYIEDTGEVNWLVSDAIQMEVPIPVISQSVMELFASRDKTKNWARAIAMMRHGFGGHPFGADPGIVRERREGRVGAIYRFALKNRQQAEPKEAKVK
ncbi:phosphogluconate dehydrogenase (NAD(+)-dependent, decarboxylating) [Candidatus Protochlamydia phocaeensis]|uniref:phosphogluconate dehydrogenase (NAD(+)-dependent, decarboxylating) n=1 Tax=Candidatus Protochlamydia phocaeensis TaxID=1414722 RepID=UPI000838583A|nr:decarboxylating 6-phosphogluconate dehydrogenase [Candidatus Protochlamydia phocaeensis]